MLSVRDLNPVTAGSFFWYDYETSGLHPGWDRPLQFGGIRTDLKLEPIGDPVVLYAQLTPDVLPHPDACLLTGITPDRIADKSLRECDFIDRIQHEFLKPKTCVLGYNSLRFDDEVTRYTLFRNLMDPYAREWRNGNSRWDIIQLARMTRALRPEGLIWPLDPQGVPSLRLDQLTRANEIPHDSAHDAMSDVFATIGLARLIRSRQPRLFDYLLAHRGKQAALHLLAPGQWKPLLHASTRYPMAHAQIGLIVAVAIHPDRSNTVIAYDLSFDPEVLKERPIFSEEAPYPRQALFTIKLNQCPALAPISVLRAQDAERLELDPDQCLRHLKALAEIDVLKSPLAQALLEETVPQRSKDIDSSLYEGFLGDRDRKTLEQFRLLAPEAMGDAELSFEDARLPEMIFRFRARNYPETLNPEELSRWQTFCRDRLLGQDTGGGLTLKDFEDRLNEWGLRGDLTTLQREILDGLQRLTSLHQA